VVCRKVVIGAPLAARGSSVLHCSRVPPPVREYFQRDIERTKKATSDRARERVAQEAAAVAGNNPAGGPFFPNLNLYSKMENQ
jgi:hypothetical protein